MRARFVVALILMCLRPSAARAADPKEPPAASEHTWGIDIWGLSYHVNRQIDYNETNWGLGVRHYARPSWKWLGDNSDNRVFFDADALQNSNRGLMLALSVGAEYELSQFSKECQLFGVGALTVAHYANAITGVNDVRFGPVPGVAIGCGRVKVNSMVILSPSRQPVAAIVAAVTIMF